MLFEERIELMRKAKIAAMIFGGVSTCICGGILGVYSSTSTVGTVAPKSDVENIYDVQSEKLANVAAVTSIKTTAVTTTSKSSTDLSVVNDSTVDETIPEIYFTTTTTATLVAESTETTPSNDDNADSDNNDVPVYNASVGGFTISGPFIATDEPETDVSETVPNVDNVSDEENVEENNETESDNESDADEEFVFEPSTEYFPPAVEYIAPAPETTETSTTATEAEIAETTTETTSVADETTTTVTTVITDEYVVATSEYTITETTAETTTESITVAESETTTTSEVITTTTESTSTEITTTVIETIVEPTESSLPITDEEYVLLCNCVANEAGSNWIDVYEKGKVVEVIMNRVNSPLYPDTIYGVITAPYQFTGSENYAYLSTYSGYVTDMVKEAVELYFNEPSSFEHNYFGFYGDGYQNHFY